MVEPGFGVQSWIKMAGVTAGEVISVTTTEFMGQLVLSILFSKSLVLTKKDWNKSADSKVLA